MTGGLRLTLAPNQQTLLATGDVMQLAVAPRPARVNQCDQEHLALGFISGKAHSRKIVWFRLQGTARHTHQSLKTHSLQLPNYALPRRPLRCIFPAEQGDSHDHPANDRP